MNTLNLVLIAVNVGALLLLHLQAVARHRKLASATVRILAQIKDLKAAAAPRRQRQVNPANTIGRERLRQRLAHKEPN
jgi:hypothetical protein